jgi:O-antigen ligase
MLPFLRKISSGKKYLINYMLGNDIYHSGNYILKNLPSNAWQYQDLWRFGIYRASSFMHHSNALGLYFVLVLSMYLFTVKKVNPGTFSLLFIGIFVSVSRIVYTLFLLLGGVQIFKGKRWLTLPAVPILVLCILMSSLPDFDMSQAVKGKVKKEDVHFRMYAKDKAMEVWRDDPLFGVGPGMFGGVVSIIFDSPIYKKHDFSEKWFNYMKPFRSLDQFWPQALAELGVVGTTLIAVLLISIFFTLFGVRKKAKDDDTRNLLAGLALATLMIFVYTMGSGLNDTSFLFTYSAFVGIGLGNENPTH